MSFWSCLKEAFSQPDYSGEIDALKKQFPKGSTVKYLGLDMCVIKHYDTCLGPRCCYDFPVLICEYADNKGNIHRHRFSVLDLDLLQGATK